MWEVITSQGHRAREIQHESDALRAVHSLGLTTLIAPTDTWFLIIGANDSSRRYITKLQLRRPTRPCRPTAEVAGLHEVPKRTEPRA